MASSTRQAPRAEPAESLETNIQRARFEYDGYVKVNPTATSLIIVEVMSKEKVVDRFLALEVNDRTYGFRDGRWFTNAELEQGGRQVAKWRFSDPTLSNLDQNILTQPLMSINANELGRYATRQPPLNEIVPKRAINASMARQESQVAPEMEQQAPPEAGAGQPEARRSPASRGGRAGPDYPRPSPETPLPSQPEVQPNTGPVPDYPRPSPETPIQQQTLPGAINSWYMTWYSGDGVTCTRTRPRGINDWISEGGGTDIEPVTVAVPTNWLPSNYGRRSDAEIQPERKYFVIAIREGERAGQYILARGEDTGRADLFPTGQGSRYSNHLDIYIGTARESNQQMRTAGSTLTTILQGSELYACSSLEEARAIIAQQGLQPLSQL